MIDRAAGTCSHLSGGVVTEGTKGNWGRANEHMCLDWLGNPLGGPDPVPLGSFQVGVPHWDFVTLTLALGEAGAGLVALVTVAVEAAQGVDAAAIGTGAGLGTAFIII